ncbi:MAG: SH3 domain-containing protein [Nitrosomonadales bacterium]|nr:SH3 domain-containing protein [Nitrosomonadales bacterium]
MKKHIVLLAVLVANMLYAAAVCAEQFYYVQSVKAKILSAPSFRSKVVAEVGMGQKLDMKGREGIWIKVANGNKEGYVSSLLVSTHPPLQKRGFIKANDAEIKMGVRRRSSAFASAAAARGLTKEDRMRADTEERVDYTALGRMEALSFSDDEVTQFAEGSKP